jgi:hypothetical protein
VTVRDREAGRLTTALSQFLAGLRAEASFVANGDVPFFPGGAQRPADIPLRFVDEGAYFYTSADIKDSAGTGSIRVASGLLDTSFRDTRACPGDPSPRDVSLTCETQALSGGGLLMTMNSAIGEAGHNIWVEVLRADGYSVIVQVLNFSAVPLAAGQTQSYRPTTPLTLTQAIALAQEPALATTIH